jgi:hypothetical protein
MLLHYQSVIAVTNPKAPLEGGEGGGDLATDITVHTAIGAPLLSRFDLILVGRACGMRRQYTDRIQPKCVHVASDAL